MEPLIDRIRRGEEKSYTETDTRSGKISTRDLVSPADDFVKWLIGQEFDPTEIATILANIQNNLSTHAIKLVEAAQKDFEHAKRWDILRNDL
jgi:hypothetical protein